MNILLIGDVIGRPGRRALSSGLEKLRRTHEIDFTIINGENIAGGFGLTRKLYDELTEHFAIDAITMGNHWLSKKEILSFYKDASRLVLPANAGNLSDEAYGLKVIPSKKTGKNVAVINLIGRVFMHPDNRSPFDSAEKLLGKIPSDVKIRIVDFHGEATSEKQVMAWHLVKRVSCLYGTHSHVPTADERILENFTGYVSDLGATGAYDSVIGMKKEAAIERMIKQVKSPSLEPASDNLWLCALIVKIDDQTGQCLEIKREQFRHLEVDN